MKQQKGNRPEARLRGRVTGVGAAMLVALGLETAAPASELIGKLEAPAISNDASAYPATFREARCWRNWSRPASCRR